MPPASRMAGRVSPVSLLRASSFVPAQSFRWVASSPVRIYEQGAAYAKLLTDKRAVVNGEAGAGAIVGFANQLLRLYEAERPRAVIVAWDILDVRGAFGPLASQRCSHRGRGRRSRPSRQTTASSDDATRRARRGSDGSKQLHHAPQSFFTNHHLTARRLGDRRCRADLRC
jgi:hypothetical protein